jgi:hypothetical protein
LSIPNPLARGEQFLRGDIDVTLNLAAAQRWGLKPLNQFLQQREIHEQQMIWG